jgi:uncharacterized protein (TIGR02145 family)
LCAGFVEGTKRLHYGKEKEQFCDERDGKEYVYVEIGTQTWMAQNLNYNASGSKCYNNSESNCNTYGRLYDWSTAMALPSSQIQYKHRGICPNGWHIPSQAEWNTLLSYVKSNSGCSNCDFSTLLKSKSGWSNTSVGSNGNGRDEYGFSALPGGSGYSSGNFVLVGINGYWLSASEYNSGSAYIWAMTNNSLSNWSSDLNKDFLYSVRCLQD